MKVKVMQVGPIGTNCYILEDEQAHVAAIIDPGDEAERILSVMGEEDATVEYILLTHDHRRPPAPRGLSPGQNLHPPGRCQWGGQPPVSPGRTGGGSAHL